MMKRKRLKPNVEGTSGGESLSDKIKWFQGGENPLLNDLILDTLFGFVRSFDLKACRLVSKQWNLHTIPHVRATFKITIHGTQSTSRTEDTRRMGDFVKLFTSNVLGMPFSKFRLGPFRTTNRVGEQFLRLCGETATEIDLDGVNEEKSEIYGIQDVSELLRSTPKLEILKFPTKFTSGSGNIVKLFPDSSPTFSSLKKITFYNAYRKEELEVCPTFIEELLTGAPHVSEIITSETPEDQEENEDEENESIAGLVLNAIEKLGLESSIQSLQLYKAKMAYVEQFRRMTEKENGLKLKKLGFAQDKLSEDDFDGVRIQLATIFSPTLRHLDVEEIVENNLMEFPYMANLKCLTLAVALQQDFTPKPVNLSLNFPSLEILVIEFLHNVGEEWSEFFSQFVTCPTIKSFILDGRISIPVFNNIKTVFPNLANLSLSVGEDGEEILREICTHMTGLEKLAVVGHITCTKKSHLDSLFTGISIQTLQRIRHVVKDLEQFTEEERRDRILKLKTNHSRHPSLRNLTKLRQLYLDVGGVKNGRVRFGVTHLTAYLTFYAMDHLRLLDLCGCELTKTCCEILTKETGLESWSFTNLESEHVIPPFLHHDGETDYN